MSIILALDSVQLHEGTVGDDGDDGANGAGGLDVVDFRIPSGVSPISSINGLFADPELAVNPLSGNSAFGIWTVRGSSLPLEAMLGVPIWRERRIAPDACASIR